MNEAKVFIILALILCLIAGLCFAWWMSSRIIQDDLNSLRKEVRDIRKRLEQEGEE